MIEYALLIMLGFCTAGLIAFLLAPTLYHRAVRLTTRRLEATMPMTLSEIEADKDLLRASYAIKLRRLEAGLNKARDKSANQLVEISKHQVRISELNERIGELNSELEERRNAANVFENTIRKRFPELETMLATASAALDERAAEIADLGVKLRRREEALEMSQRSSGLQQEEIRKLRDTLERAGADITGRFKKRPAQWGLDEYRSEYDRLNVELSKMREQLILAQDREKRQIAVLKTELQQLAERIMLNAAAERAAAELREPERMGPTRAEAPVSRPATPQRGAAPPPPASPRGWTGSGPGRGGRLSSRMASAADSAKTKVGEAAPTETATVRGAALTSSASQQPVAAAPEPAGKDSDEVARTALKSLLDRGARLPGKELFDKAEKAPQAAVSGAIGLATDRPEASAAAAEIAAKQGFLAQAPVERPVPAPAAETAAASVSQAPAGGEAEAPRQQPLRSEPQLDRVFREIIEGRPAPQVTPPASSAQPGGDTAVAEKPAVDAESPAAKSDTGDSTTKTLLDRLRHIQERQTG